MNNSYTIHAKSLLRPGLSKSYKIQDGCWNCEFGKVAYDSDGFSSFGVKAKIGCIRLVNVGSGKKRRRKDDLS